MTEYPKKSFAFQIIGQALPTLLGTAILGVSAGLLLELRAETMGQFPGIFIPIPIFMALTGGIGSIVGSKFTTAHHLGNLTTVEGKIETYLGNSLIIVVTGAFISLLIGGLTILLASVFSLPLPGLNPYLTTLLLCFITGLACTLLSVCAAILVGQFAFRRGLDPDNLIMPLVSSFGDVFAIIVLLTTLHLIL
ncbi:MAG: magnesium transporter [Candidatus Heimdallarchaeota archaeon]